MKTIRFARSGFPNTSMLYWATYFKSILETKYKVVIDNENPDIVLYSNVHYHTGVLDTFNNSPAKSHLDYPASAKRIFCSGEDVTSHSSMLAEGDNYFAIGPEPYDHPRYLRLQMHNTTAAWGLYDESGLVDHPYKWLTEPRSGLDILQKKKHFCGMVQNSSIPYRIDLFNALSEYKFVRASGAWLCNVPPEEATIAHAAIDGVGYRSKIDFLRSCKFSIQVQSSNSKYFTHEKMIHAYSANTIPIFYGNSAILEDGFNPDTFINCHDFDSIDAIIERVKEIDNNDELFVKMIEAPYFVGNILPHYYDPEYLLSFIETVVNS